MDGGRALRDDGTPGLGLLRASFVAASIVSCFPYPIQRFFYAYLQRIVDGCCLPLSRARRHMRVFVRMRVLLLLHSSCLLQQQGRPHASTRGIISHDISMSMSAVKPGVSLRLQVECVAALGQKEKRILRMSTTSNATSFRKNTIIPGTTTYTTVRL